MKETLFTRLASYSQNHAKQSLENFTTEVIVYLINEDKTFRNIFIYHIIRKKRIQQLFKPSKLSKAESQQSFDNSIVDIVLTSGHYKLLVEVKLAARETETKIYGKGRVLQIQKYINLNVGDVVYLTTKAVSAPKLKATPTWFLGQFYFEDLYDHLVKAKSKLSQCGKLFLDFMKENDMKSIEPFNKHEIAIAKDAFGFAKKCEGLLNEIRHLVEPEFHHMFGSQLRLTGGQFDPTLEEAYIYTNKRVSKYKKVRYVAIDIFAEDGKLFYGVLVKVLKTEMMKLNQHLKWKEDRGVLFHSHPIKPDMKALTYVKPILNDLKYLERALNKIY